MSATNQTVDVLGELQRLADAVETLDRVTARLGYDRAYTGFREGAVQPESRLDDAAWHVVQAATLEPGIDVPATVERLRAEIRLASGAVAS